MSGASHTSPTEALCAVGALFYDRGWSYATSSNYSVVLGRTPLRLLITASGRDKRRLGPGDLVVVDEDGRLVEPSGSSPSAETLLHLAMARRPDVGAVLHTHSVWSTVLSDLHFRNGGFEVAGYEMLKGLSGIASHEDRVRVEIFENTQDMVILRLETVRRHFTTRERGEDHWVHGRDDSLSITVCHAHRRSGAKGFGLS